MTGIEKALRDRAVVDAYAVTRDPDAVGAQFGLSPVTVRGIWRRLGRTGEEKAAKQRARSERRRRLAADYESGELVKLVAYHHGVSEWWVGQAAKREGVALRVPRKAARA